MSESYHSTRLTEDPRRDVLWRTLCESYFARLVAPGDCALDLGSGYGGFINHIPTAKRIAVDAWPGFIEHLAPGVKGVVGPVHELGFLDDGSVDFAFASNVFEHVTQEELAQCLRSLKPKLSAKGTINILQPNYRYCSTEYFDDYTHKSIWSHVSLPDFLRVQGYEVLDVQPRFMPLSVKSRLPVSPALIRLYLWSPVKPLGKQMLVRARPMKA